MMKEIKDAPTADAGKGDALLTVVSRSYTV